MNPVENLWSLLDKFQNNKHVKPASYEELLQLPYSTWVEIPQLKMAKLVTFMPAVKALTDDY